MKTEDIKKMLMVDPLSLAEEITGKSYKEDKDTSNLGLWLHIKHNEKKNRVLNAIGDTTFSMKLSDYFRVIKGFGFEDIYVEDFSDKDGKDNKLYVLYHYDLGILLSFDTYFGNSVNGGKFYYNWSPNIGFETGNCTSSGGFYFSEGEMHIGLIDENLNEYRIPNYPKEIPWTSQSCEQFKLENKQIWEDQQILLEGAFGNGKRTVWIGNHDCREAVISNIKLMQECGKFLPTWIKQPTPFWVMTYADWEKNEDKQYHDADAITEKRIASFPIEVQERIKGKK